MTIEDKRKVIFMDGRLIVVKAENCRVAAPPTQLSVVGQEVNGEMVERPSGLSVPVESKYPYGYVIGTSTGTLIQGEEHPDEESALDAALGYIRAHQEFLRKCADPKEDWES